MNPQMPKLAVVIPCFKVRKHILGVLSKIPSDVNFIYVVDDFCPERTGEYVKTNFLDARLTVIKHKINYGVGGAVMSGYKAAIVAGADIIIKIDGDGQMDPSLIPNFVLPIIRGEADYTKGNRFYDLDALHKMPFIRILGNSILSFASKISTGYWNSFDATNGYTAIQAKVAEHLPYEKISKSYFFESDILFRLNIFRAVIMDIPIDASYGDEISNLRIKRIFLEFFLKHIKNTFKRIFYNYYLRDISIASFELPLGILFTATGVIFGIYIWWIAVESRVPTPTGTIMLATLPIIVGINLLLSFINYDIASCPTRVMYTRINRF
jgi:hypothetical protein